MTKNTWIAIIVVVIIIIAGVWYYQTNRQVPVMGEPIKIGAIAPLTGWGDYWGEGYVKGIQVAIDDIESQGGSIEVVVEDGNTDAQKSATAAQKLINVDKVGALMVEFTAPSSSVSPISVQNKIPMLYDAVTKSFLASNPYALKMYFDMDQQCYVATKQLAIEGHKKIAVFSINQDFASECEIAANRVAKENGITVVSYLFNVDTTDFRTILSKMKSEKVDAVVPVFFEDHAIAFFKQKQDLKFNVPVFMGIGIPDGFTTKVRNSVSAESVEGVRTYDQVIDEGFKNKLSTKYPNITENEFLSAAYGYDEVTYLYQAMSKCETDNAECVVKNIQGNKSKGALSSPGFNNDRVLNVTAVYYKFTEGKLQDFKPSI